MGSDVDMGVNLDSAMVGVSQNVPEDSNAARLPEEVLGICESNREDDAFTVEVSPDRHDRGLVDAIGNGEDVEVDIVGNVVADEGEKRTVERESQDATENYDARGSGGDVEVDIVGNLVANEGEKRTVERESLDATETSSSFGCTDSGSGSETADASGDMEVESQFRDDKASMMAFDRFTDIFGTRRKKSTPHWRQYIRPLMWRCKWAELRIRELQYQASKYCSEVEKCDKRKQFQLDKYATEDHAAKSVPFVCRDVPVKVMKRKKRKRVEETVDLASYTTCHNLFSYFVSKRSRVNCAYLDGDHSRTGKSSSESGEFGIESIEFKDSDAFEDILRKVEEAQVHVRQLRIRMDKVVREYTENLALDKSSFVPCHPSTSCAPKLVLPHLNKEAVPLGSMATTCQWTPNKLSLPETVVTVSEEVAPLPSGIKSTDHPQIEIKCEKTENGIQICSRPVKEELNNPGAVQAQLVAESCSAAPEGKAERVQHVPVSTPPSKVAMFQEQPTVKIRSSPNLTTPKNKRKRGRRKAGAGRWNQKPSVQKSIY